MFASLASKFGSVRLHGNFGSLSSLGLNGGGSLLAPTNSPNVEQVRTIIKFSHRKGTKRSLGAAVNRFYRLNCGLWIHALPGRHKKHWKKTQEQIAELQKHVFMPRRQNTVVDKMFSPYFKKPSYLPDSPYEPYHNFKVPNHVYKSYK